MKKTIYLFLISIFSFSFSHPKNELDHKTFWNWEKGRIHYVEKGEGPNHVVLLHGFGANTFTWKAQMDVLSEQGFHVWALDFLGFGFSDKPLQTEYSIELYREQVEDFFKEKEIEKAHIMANSMGGAIALGFTAKSPEKVSSLTLIDPLAYPVKMPFIYAVGQKFGKLMIPFFSRGLVHKAMKRIYYDPKKITEELLDAYWAPYEMEGGKEVVIQILRSFDPHDLKELCPSYSKMKMPVLLIWGENDTWIPLSHLDALLKDFPHAKQKVIPSCGHAPQEEKPEEVNPLILDVLREFVVEPAKNVEPDKTI